MSKKDGKRVFDSDENEFLEEAFSKNSYPSKKKVEEFSKKLGKSERRIKKDDDFFDQLFNENVFYSERITTNKTVELITTDEKLSSEIQSNFDVLTFDLKNAEKKISELLNQLKEKEDLIFAYSEENNEKIEELNAEIFRIEKSLDEKNRLIENLKDELLKKNLEIESHLFKSCEMNEINKNIRKNQKNDSLKIQLSQLESEIKITQEHKTEVETLNSKIKTLEQNNELLTLKYSKLKPAAEFKNEESCKQSVLLSDDSIEICSQKSNESDEDFKIRV
ncbi:unnamed protein product [Brachionus calyciflorus]|uniref:Homeobox domain-containing protein n=1 Tax=Brachionus calyciflorus TaxID=104777 RepID=A0A813QLM8_9BILA|nr:unnamed protein product [Brachionus calyciflorus]